MPKKYSSKVYEYDDEEEDEVKEVEKLKIEEKKKMVVKTSNSSNNNNEQTKIVNNQNIDYVKDKNVVAQIIKIISYVIVVLGFICLLGSGDIIVGIAFLASFLLSAIFVYSLGEIIQILHDIRNKL